MHKPTRKHEEWRYSDLTLLDDVSSYSSSPRSIDDDGGSYCIMLVDGVMDPIRSNLPVKGIELDATIRHCERSAAIHLPFFVSRKDGSPRCARNDENGGGFNNKYQVLQNYSKARGVLITVIDTLDKPLRLCYLGACTVLIRLKHNVHLKLYEEFVQSHNHVTKIVLDENSHCKHFKLHNLCLYSAHVTCEAGSEYNSYEVNTGCQSLRCDIECELQGERASCNFFGINIGKGEQRYDVVLNVKHNSSNTRSRQHYNQILSDNSLGSFYTKVTIPASLSGIEAHQFNKNLLLGEKSKAFCRPELDIDSDDVVCSHGATIGTIDEEAMAYLKSRGLDHKAAEKLILQGFSSEVFEKAGLDEEEYKRLVAHE